MRYLTVDEVLALQKRIIDTSGGRPGLRYSAGLESAIAQPQVTFEGIDLYMTLASKASALAYSLIMNHPFVDGNKRVGHAAMEVMLVLNGWQLSATVDEQERIVLAVASGAMSREEFAGWIEAHVLGPTEDETGLGL
jgi:death-on-curing protein